LIEEEDETNYSNNSQREEEKEEMNNPRERLLINFGNAVGPDIGSLDQQVKDFQVRSSQL
jgi:hypothetical protein